MTNIEHFKRKARYLAKEAIRLGKIHKSSNCEICGLETHLYMHHNDYSKPLQVEWLCKNCH